jgi:hypothetical protein
MMPMATAGICMKPLSAATPPGCRCNEDVAVRWNPVTWRFPAGVRRPFHPPDSFRRSSRLATGDGRSPPARRRPGKWFSTLAA